MKTPSDEHASRKPTRGDLYLLVSFAAKQSREFERLTNELSDEMKAAILFRVTGAAEPFIVNLPLAGLVDVVCAVPRSAPTLLRAAEAKTKSGPSEFSKRVRQKLNVLGTSLKGLIFQAELLCPPALEKLRDTGEIEQAQVTQLSEDLSKLAKGSRRVRDQKTDERLSTSAAAQKHLRAACNLLAKGTSAEQLASEQLGAKGKELFGAGWQWRSILDVSRKDDSSRPLDDVDDHQRSDSGH